jgi:hypothetical protein
MPGCFSTFMSFDDIIIPLQLLKLKKPVTDIIKEDNDQNDPPHFTKSNLYLQEFLHAQLSVQIEYANHVLNSKEHISKSRAEQLARFVYPMFVLDTITS